MTRKWVRHRRRSALIRGDLRLLFAVPSAFGLEPGGPKGRLDPKLEEGADGLGLGGIGGKRVQVLLQAALGGPQRSGCGSDGLADPNLVLFGVVSGGDGA